MVYFEFPIRNYHFVIESVSYLCSLPRNRIKFLTYEPNQADTYTHTHCHIFSMPLRHSSVVSWIVWGTTSTCGLFPLQQNRFIPKKKQNRKKKESKNGLCLYVLFLFSFNWFYFVVLKSWLSFVLHLRIYWLSLMWGVLFFFKFFFCSVFSDVCMFKCGNKITFIKWAHKAQNRKEQSKTKK